MNKHRFQPSQVQTLEGRESCSNFSFGWKLAGRTITTFMEREGFHVPPAPPIGGAFRLIWPLVTGARDAW